ncbi:hypothetical protein MBM_05680 [Drepanopeziza brunnea f. sp. 'multigermtubi' MB_m1]|uniref:Uncharacterized protein n=1 Tax=Marssonina brunnea f. sp. multigermtubi (strain MB_m1) TaxID=1072389 RepID=K1WTJ6_MARBU|nr:uncharacterized protein MBM_05680 [Drepanopeziza brunnea f. sp. 'multigermtubi' MB_m1]EKD16386.1 hypothetical protein MBM_05680 [Drepanopeziza brunnea f. sp. 'multigermtubi' MB_m1]
MVTELATPGFLDERYSVDHGSQLLDIADRKRLVTKLRGIRATEYSTEMYIITLIGKNVSFDLLNSPMDGAQFLRPSITKCRAAPSGPLQTQVTERYATRKIPGSKNGDEAAAIATRICRCDIPASLQPPPPTCHLLLHIFPTLYDNLGSLEDMRALYLRISTAWGRFEVMETRRTPKVKTLVMAGPKARIQIFEHVAKT